MFRRRKDLTLPGFIPPPIPLRSRCRFDGSDGDIIAFLKAADNDRFEHFRDCGLLGIHIAQAKQDARGTYDRLTARYVEPDRAAMLADQQFEWVLMSKFPSFGVIKAPVTPGTLEPLVC